MNCSSECVATNARTTGEREIRSGRGMVIVPVTRTLGDDGARAGGSESILDYSYAILDLDHILGVFTVTGGCVSHMCASASERIDHACRSGGQGEAGAAT